MNLARIYSFTNWSLTPTERRLTCRPSIRTFGVRLLGTAIAAGILAALVHYHDWPEVPRATASPQTSAPAEDAHLRRIRKEAKELKNSLTSPGAREKIEEFERELESRRAERETERQTHRKKWNVLAATGQWLYLVLFSAVAFAGLLAPLSALWQQVTIELDLQNKVRLTHLGVVPAPKSLVFQSCSMIAVFVEEVIHHRREGEVREGWRWRVQLHGTDETGSSMLTELWPEMEKTPPAMLKYLPERVKSVVQFLERITGVKAQPAAQMKVSGIERGLFSDTITSTATSVSERPVSQQTFKSLDEVPPHLRPEVEKMLGQAGGQGPVSHQTIRFRDREGNEQIYRSVEEMPTEVRAIFERARESRDQTR